MWLNHFKSDGNIESYNAVFIESKDIQNSRLKMLYLDNPSFQTFFRWRLSELLNFYVRYGTDPARAIVISQYIMVAFAILFFFFPSVWDTTSKKKLFENYGAFIQKNDKEYVKPFWF